MNTTQQTVTLLEFWSEPKRLSVTQSNVSRIEIGQRVLRVESLIRLADAIDADIATILEIVLGKKF